MMNNESLAAKVCSFVCDRLTLSLLEKTPNGKFWSGKSLSSGMGMKDIVETLLIERKLGENAESFDRERNERVGIWTCKVSEEKWHKHFRLSVRRVGSARQRFYSERACFQALIFQVFQTLIVARASWKLKYEKKNNNWTDKLFFVQNINEMK